MSKVQTIRSPSGDELVVLPRADYDALIEAVEAARQADEDAEDLAIAEARMAEHLAAGGAALPAEVGAAMMRGDSLIKALRKWRGLKQGDLAKAIGVAQGYVSDLESRRRHGSEETLRAIAGALDVSPMWLLEKP